MWSEYYPGIENPGERGIMMHTLPIDLNRVKQEDIDREILRTAIIAELDAVNLYEQMAALAKDVNIKKVLIDIAGEEKTHIGEFQTMLLMKDEEQVKELEAGRKEVEEMMEE
jgi:rubrerythrin